VTTAADADDAVGAAERDLAAGVGDVVLLKASRGIALDRTVAALAAGGPPR
jgi:UDP-N-acetylmuramyl pentapeptide synthase